MLTVLSVDVLCFHTIYSVVFISFLAPFYVVDFSISYYLQYCTISWGLFFFFLHVIVIKGLRLNYLQHSLNFP